jgi:hypothetical protein
MNEVYYIINQPLILKRDPPQDKIHIYLFYIHCFLFICLGQEDSVF